MARVAFTPNLEKHLAVPEMDVEGESLKEVLAACFKQNPDVRSYIVDDQGRVRKHVAVFIDGKMIDDKDSLSDPVASDSAVFVMQALSGG